MTPQETVEQIYVAFGRGDIPFIISQVATSCEWRQSASAPWGGDYRGPEGVATFFGKLNDLVETTGFEVDNNIASGPDVVSFGYYSSRNRATGKSSRARFVFHWHFDQGKVARYEAVLETAPIVAAAA